MTFEYKQIKSKSKKRKIPKGLSALEKELKSLFDRVVDKVDARLKRR
jgi:hypothetical protein